MKKHHIVPIILIGLSILVMALSYKLGLEKISNPGPGFMPFVVSLLLLLISLYFLLSLLFKKGNEAEIITNGKEKPNVRRISIVVLSLFAYALFVERVGFLITGTIILILIFRYVGYKWRFVLITSVVTILITYFFFTYLGVRFPMGILESLRF